MEYVQLKHAKSDDIVIFAKRFWTKDGKRIVANLGGMRAGFDSAVAQSLAKRISRQPPNHTRKITARETADHALYTELRAFAEEMGWSASRTGEEIRGDPRFLFDVRDGRHPKPETLERVRQRMGELRDGRNKLR